MAKLIPPSCKYLLDLGCGTGLELDEIFKIMPDIKVSFETMHHFSKESKLELYKKLYQALAPSGMYIECDYMTESHKEEDFCFALINKAILIHYIFSSH